MQGEDIFLDDLHEPYRTEVHEAIREKARDVDAFVATSDYYVDYMGDYLGVPAERVHRVRLGIRLDGYGENPSEKCERPFMIGYLARVCPEKGLHDLVEAFKVLAQQVGPNRSGFESQVTSATGTGTTSSG